MKSWTTLIFSLTFSILTFAQSNPCQSDIQKFCPGVAPGHGALVECLKKHKDELSKECRAQGESMKKHLEQKREACADDVEQFCSAAKADGGSVAKCLRDHQQELSEACKNTFHRKK